MIVAKFVILLVILGLALYKLPWIYEKFVGATDNQMDSISKTNKKSTKRATKRNK